MVIPDTGDPTANIAGLEALLNKPDWREAADEFEAARKRLRRRPEWCQLFDPEAPGSLEELAVRVGCGGQYEILYRYWSATAHAGDSYSAV